jgi:hypothetical protein
MNYVWIHVGGKRKLLSVDLEPFLNLIDEHVTSAF